MKSRNFTRWFAGVMLAAGLVAGGCESGGGDKYRAPLGWVAPEGDPYGMMRRPTPAPERRVEQPRREEPRREPPARREEPRARTDGDVMYLPTGDRSTSALSLRCAMPAEVIAGSNFTYDLEVCNLTSMTLNGVVVTYTLDGARLVSSDPAATGGNAFAVGDLAPRQCKTVKITASPSGTGMVRGCASATWNNALCCATQVVQPALQVVKTVSPSEGTPCDTFTYRIEVTNTGTGAATNVRLTDTLPEGVTSENRRELSWDLGRIPAGQTVTRSFQAKAARPGQFSNTARVAADNNLAAESAAVGVVIRQPVLALAKQCPGTLRLGVPANFRITVSNRGEAPATDVVVEDTLPQGATFASASDGGRLEGNRVIWNVGTLAPGASRELTVSANVTGQGSMQNSATARATCAEAVSANCSFSVQGAPDMRTALDDAEGVVLVGGTHVYTYSVGNQGQVPLTGVTVKITLPAGVQFVAAEQGLSPRADGQVQTYNIGTLAPGQNRRFTFTVRGTQPGEVLVISETSCNELKTPVRDDEITNFIEP